MNIYPYIIIGTSVIIDFVIVWICTLQYKNTKFTPNLLLLIFYVLFGCNDLIYFCIFFLPENYLSLATILLDFTLYLGFMTFPLLIIFFESLYKPKLSFWGIFIMILSGFMMGFTLGSRSTVEYIQNYGWNQFFPNPYLIMAGLYFFLFLVAMTYQFYRYLSISPKREDKSAKIGLLSLVCAFIGEFIAQALDIIFFKQVSLTLGFLIFSITYYRDPRSFILTPIEHFQFFLFDKESGLMLFKEGSNISIITQGLNASTIIQQEIAGALKPAQELIYGDRIFIIEHQQVQNRKILAVIIVDKKIIGLRQSLKYALNLFISMFTEELISRFDEIEKYSTFSKEIHQIFHYIPSL